MLYKADIHLKYDVYNIYLFIYSFMYVFIYIKKQKTETPSYLSVGLEGSCTVLGLHVRNVPSGDLSEVLAVDHHGFVGLAAWNEHGNDMERPTVGLAA